MKKFFIVLGFILLCCGCVKKAGTMVEKKILVKSVSYSYVYKVINHYDLYQDIEILDVRGEDDYEEGHIIGSISISFSDLDDLEISKDKKIIVYAEDKKKSFLACRKLIELGYSATYLPGIEKYPYDLV